MTALYLCEESRNPPQPVAHVTFESLISSQFFFGIFVDIHICTLSFLVEWWAPNRMVER
jgi:hypothetical protein